MEIRRDDLTGPEIRALLEEHLADMHSISPPESVHALDLEKLRRPDITFWTVWSDASGDTSSDTSGDTSGDTSAGTSRSELLGCGALKEIDPSHGEIKSMRTTSPSRRGGVGKAMLKHIVEEAMRRNYHRLSLETGSQPEFEPARKLYESFGFTFCPPFGDYRDDPNSVFMTRVLETSPPVETAIDGDRVD